jgi:4-hydroxy-2-oxoheptanedioate aldolase
VQAESRKAIENIDDIAGTEGVDCVFIGPSDLSADMGYLGNPDAPEVVEAIPTASPASAPRARPWASSPSARARRSRWAEAGVQFIATASDVKCLAWTRHREGDVCLKPAAARPAAPVRVARWKAADARG